MVDIFEEVDEELRRDKYQDLLRRYGPWVLGAAVAIVAVAAGYQGWTAWSTSQKETASDGYVAAMTLAEAGRTDRAIAQLGDVRESATRGYATLALLQQGNLAIEQGDSAAAAEYFEEAARSTSDPFLADLAEIKAVWALWDSLSVNEIELRLNPLIDTGAPYRDLAREAIAAAALRDGDLARARETYQVLGYGLDTPEGIARRAQEALARIDQLGGAPGADTAPADAAPATDAMPDTTTTDNEPMDAGEAGDE